MVLALELRLLTLTAGKPVTKIFVLAIHVGDSAWSAVRFLSQRKGATGPKSGADDPSTIPSAARTQAVLRTLASPRFTSFRIGKIRVPDPSPAVQ